MKYLIIALGLAVVALVLVATFVWPFTALYFGFAR